MNMGPGQSASQLAEVQWQTVQCSRYIYYFALHLLGVSIVVHLALHLYLSILHVHHRIREFKLFDSC